MNARTALAWRGLRRCACGTATGLALPAVAGAQPGLVGFYRFENGTPGQGATAVVDSSPLGNHGVAQAGPLYSTDVHTACAGVSDGSLSLRVSTSQSVFFPGVFPFNAPGDATIAFWIKSSFSHHGAVIYGHVGDPSGSGFQFFVNSDRTFGFNYREPGDALHCLGYCHDHSGVPVAADQWTHLAVVRQGETYRVYRNGVLAATQVDQNPVHPGTAGWGVGTRAGFPFDGFIDDLRVYTRAVAPEELSATLVINHPTHAAACVGDGTVFSVVVAGAGPFLYQWRRDGVAIDPRANPSAATAELALVDVQADDAGDYDCFVSGPGGCGAVTSDGARLFVDPADVGAAGGVPGRDGVHDNNDFVVFIDLFFSRDARADLGRQGGELGADGVFDNNDFIVFIDRFFAGC